MNQKTFAIRMGGTEDGGWGGEGRQNFNFGSQYSCLFIMLPNVASTVATFNVIACGRGTIMNMFDLVIYSFETE